MKLTNDGWLHRDEQLVVFFGHRQIDRAQLQELFPELQWATLEQVHSPTVIVADPTQERRGDAHFTNSSRLGLIIKTADCLPVMLASDRGQVAAIHAGWRGVTTDIVTNAVRHLLRLTEKAPLRAWIGPHIQWESFEVGEDVLDLLRHAFLRASPQGQFETICKLHPRDPKKRFVNLTAIVRAQLQAHDVMIVDEVTADTKTTPTLASYRRDGQSAGRNLSFIARL